VSHTEAPISITVKSAAGSLITIRASNAEELDQSVALSLASLASATAELEAAVRSTNTAVPPQPATATVAAAFNATVIDSSPSQGAGSRVCPHGTMTRIHGLTGKFGPYKGYFCPAKQGDATKCTTQYIKPAMAEWNTFQPDQTKA
jgi:hypothetical protein